MLHSASLAYVSAHLVSFELTFLNDFNDYLISIIMAPATRARTEELPVLGTAEGRPDYFIGLTSSSKLRA